jgi:hypothetical protein
VYLASPAVQCTACKEGYTYVFADVAKNGRYASPTCVKKDPEPKKEESKKEDGKKGKKDPHSGYRALREMNVEGGMMGMEMEMDM